MNKSLGPISSTLILELKRQNKAIFTLRDAQKITKTGYDATRLLLNQLERKKWLKRIKGGKYFIIPLEAGVKGEYMENWYMIAKELIHPIPYYISYYSAMNIHNMVTQPLSIVYIASPVRRRDRNIGGANFKFVYTKKEKFWGVIKDWVTPQEQVQVSDLERTVIDCLYIPEYCGGISEIAKGIWITKDNIDYKKLYEYTHKFKKIVVAKRLGFILETYGIDKENIISLLHSDIEKHKSYALLDPVLPGEGKYTKHWYLKINLNPEELKAVVRT